ncbi:MAG: hypothetical protein R3E66_07530 [bacterium]
MTGKVGLSYLSLRAAILSLSMMVTVLTACGDDGGTSTNLCKNVTCDGGGVCDSATGQCANPDSCTEDSVCLPGYACNGSTCEAEIACDNGACERGVCSQGACINPAGCTTNANCLSGFYCGEGNTCEADPCGDTTCERGVCEVGTGACVNAAVCTTATEATDCLDGNKCVGGQCQAEADFCATLDCQRGVCSFDDLACVDADNCGGDDGNCLAGNYCADDNTCKPNVCDALNQMCARGECDPASGQCVNADACTSQTNCIDDFVCVGGSCVASADACGADGCPGNQVCNYDDGSASATCGENPAGCTSALDCDGDRICDGGACAAPGVCEADAFEPNDTAGSETVYVDANSGLPVEMTICGTDVDRISYNTLDDADLTGTLVAEVTIDASDVGLGVLSLDLVDENGTSVGTATSEVAGVQTGSARVEFAVTALNGGRYTLVVSGAVSTAGVRYTARMDVVDAGVIAACAAPAALTVGTPVAGTTEGGTSALTSSCGDADGAFGESVYTFTVDRSVFATFVASPLSSTTDLAVNIRSVCEQTDTELGCADTLGANRNETLQLRLDPGTYIVVVEAASATGGGQFALTASVEDIVCSITDNSCIDADNANVCNANGTGFDAVACENGCDSTIGSCGRAEGDTCAFPIVVDPATGYTGNVEWNLYVGDYDPGDPSCVPGNTGTNYTTDGPDAVYSIDVPDDYVVSAFIDQRGSNYISAYIVEDCGDIENTCLLGSNAIRARATRTCSGTTKRVQRRRCS